MSFERHSSIYNLNLLEQITRTKVYNCNYWKEKCFSLTSDSLLDRVFEIQYIGGIIPTTNQPTDFLCLLVKLLQLNPKEEIIYLYLDDISNKYLRALTVFYIRLTFPPIKVYTLLENLYSDYSKLRMINNKGKFEIIHMDEFIDNLLTKESIFNIAMPQLTKRYILEETGKLPPRKSLLDDDLKVDIDEKEEEEDFDIFKDIKLPNDFFKEKKRQRSENNINEKKPEKKQKTEDNNNISSNNNTNNNNMNDNNNTNNNNMNDNNKENEEIDISKLDPNSDEYWLALRKKIGLN